jgi:hypothetical protein
VMLGPVAYAKYEKPFRTLDSMKPCQTKQIWQDVSNLEHDSPKRLLDSHHAAK